MKPRTRVPLVGLVAACIALASIASAQEFGEISAAFRDNLEALRGYSWKSKVEFSLDGVLRSTKTYDVLYTRDGRLERTLTSEKRRGKASKQERAAEIQLSNIRTMIDGYTHMDPKAFRAAFGENYRKITTDGDELIHVETTNFLSRGDRASVWVDSGTYRMRKMEFDTTHLGQPTYVLVKFESVEGGAAWVVSSVMSTQHKKKAMRLVTKNSDPTPPGR